MKDVSGAGQRRYGLGHTSLLVKPFVSLIVPVVDLSLPNGVMDSFR